jgi:hypothetical protein
MHDQIGLWVDQPDPPCTEVSELARSTTLTDDLLDQKIAALEAHASQTGPLIELLGPATYREWWRTESFRSAAASSPRCVTAARLHPALGVLTAPAAVYDADRTSVR